MDIMTASRIAQDIIEMRRLYEEEEPEDLQDCVTLYNGILGMFLLDAPTNGNFVEVVEPRLLTATTLEQIALGLGAVNTDDGIEYTMSQENEDRFREIIDTSIRFLVGFYNNILVLHTADGVPVYYSEEDVDELIWEDDVDVFDVHFAHAA